MLTVYSPMLWKWRKEDLIQFYYMITWALPLAINLWHGGYGFHNLVDIFANIITMHYFYLKYSVYKGSYNKIFKARIKTYSVYGYSGSAIRPEPLIMDHEFYKFNGRCHGNRNNAFSFISNI